ncbi:MAG: Re/Si-specific NAD(P)(+) transhydrogenase subunit alpha [Zetaproteobacteria bacterium]|nr:Re/Si-specific NAD(P)(+) transhydrogenase subunit alpha [Zetaproteobacteria bacterium]
MRIAVPAEIANHENRVAITPEVAKKLVLLGHRVVVQKGAGVASRYTDASYEAVGAEMACDAAATYADASMVLKVKAPLAEEVKLIAENAVVVAMFSPYTNPLLQTYNEAKLSCFSMEMIPRTSRAQSMDVLSSQANIAGYKAVLMAVEYYQRFMPMLMTAAGTVQPAKVLVMGAGVAGLQAIATARRLGAMVEAFDVRAAAKEQVESLGARFVEVPVEGEGEDAGGYAKEMSDAYKQKQSELIAKHVAAADIIITTALIPGRSAPVLVSETMLETMKPGSVVVDLAAEMGGNCPLTKLNEVYEHQGVTLVGIANIPSLMATDASSLYARNVLNFITLMLNKEDQSLHLEGNSDDIIVASMLCHQGEFMKPQLLSGGAA